MRDVVSVLEERLRSPTSKGLAAAVSRAIADGVLEPGARLPPIRTVATELALSPTTVSAAWGVLARSGVVRTHGRRGTVVADPAETGAARYRRAVDHPTPLRQDLSTGVPDGALLPTLTDVLSRLEQVGAPDSYLEDPVVPELADLLRRDWPYPAPALTVVDGAMDGLDLVARVRFRVGDRVVVEHPCFPPILDLLETQPVEVVGVPLDEEGLDLRALADALRTPAAAVVLQPRAQNPTGVTMTGRRAHEVAALLRDTEVTVIEDDSFHGLAQTPAVSLGSWLPERTVHVRSYSKSHGPDLRLAAMSGPRELLRAVEGRRHLGQGWSSRLLQRILLGLLTDPRAADQVSLARSVYAERRVRLVTALAAHGVPVGGSDGLNLWVPVADETATVARLASEGIGVSAGAPFAALPGMPTMPGHVRVTAGLVRDGHDHLAALIAGAARAGGRTARSR